MFVREYDFGATTWTLLQATLDKPLTYLCHLLEFLHVSSEQVKEGETVKVLGTLVSHLHDLCRCGVWYW